MSSNPLAWVGSLLSIADKTTEIIKETVTDVDKANELIANMEKIKEGSSFLAALSTQTVPWLDGLHKMGRQILNIATIIAVLILLLNDIEITGPAALVLGGPNAAYQFIKGKGK